MTLTPEQSKILERADKFGWIEINDDKTCPGIHFCPDWNDLPICQDSPEAECCTCGLLKKGEE